MSEVVLDASAVLSVLNQEDGSQAIAGSITNAAISTAGLCIELSTSGSLILPTSWR
jgi:PIN domain nuclease of toxin-antitoxin system